MPAGRPTSPRSLATMITSGTAGTLQRARRGAPDQRAPHGRIPGVTEQDILDRGIELIAISFVDNAGLTRAKSITAAKAESAARRGVGSPQAFSIFQGDDGMATAT